MSIEFAGSEKNTEKNLTSVNEGENLLASEVPSLIGSEVEDDALLEDLELISISDDQASVVISDDFFDDLDDDDFVKESRKHARRIARYDPLRSTALLTDSLDGDPVRLYLREIGRIPLITAEEEIAYAKRIERGISAAEQLAELTATGELENLTPVQQRRLHRMVLDGEHAKEDLTQANLRLVVSIAKRFNAKGMQLLDLIQEGNLGLIRAVEKFDYTKGFKLSTYATWWIRQAISRAIADQARTIRIPVHMVELVNKVYRIKRELSQELEREPTLDEVAIKADLSVERVQEILRISQDPLSLDLPIGEQNEGSLGDILEDSQRESPEIQTARHMLAETVLEALDDLHEREKAVMRMRFGLDDGQVHTLEEVGQEFGVTRERIRQIEARTLAKLRQPENSKKLRDYFENE